MKDFKNNIKELLNHIDNHKESYIKNEWTNEDIVEAWFKSNKPILKYIDNKRLNKLLIKFLRWQYDDEKEFEEGDSEMVNTFLKEFN